MLIGENMNKKLFDLNKLYIITDFDHTLTTKNSQNCWGVLATIPHISEDYIVQSIKNNDYYFPIEQNDLLDYETKNQMMYKWYQNHAELLVKYNLQEKDINEISQNNSIILRGGVVNFFKYTNKNNIPVIIISAGISNVIKGVLKKYNCFFNNVYVISNIFKFKEGKLKSLRNNIIHSLNKNKVEVPPKIKEILQNKDQAIIIGDNTGDTLMKVKENSKTFKIGFLNYNDNLKLQEFKKYFDVIYTDKNDFNDIIKLIKQKS